MKEVPYMMCYNPETAKMKTPRMLIVYHNTTTLPCLAHFDYANRDGKVTLKEYDAVLLSFSLN